MQPPSDDTESLRTRLAPSQQTLAILLCVLLTVGPVGVAMSQSVEDPGILWTAANNNSPQDISAGPDGAYVAATYGSQEETVLWHARNGTQAWTYSHTAPGGLNNPDGRAVTSDDDVYVAMSPDAGAAIDRVDKETGSNVWRRDVSESISAINEIDHDDTRLFAVGNNNGMAVFSKSGGSLVWNNTSIQARDVAAAASKGVAYVTGDSNVTAYDSATGDVEWVADLNTDQIQRVTVNKNETVVYASSDNPDNDDPDDVFAIDADSGAVLWQKQTQADTSGGTDRPVVVNPDGDTLYVGSQNDDWISVMAASTGLTDKRWNASGPLHLDVSPDGGSLYVARSGTHNDIAAIDTGGGYTVTGEVTDQAGRSVGGATITANSSVENDSATTAPDGTYELTLLEGEYNLTADKSGYISQTVNRTITNDTEQDFQLLEEDAALRIKSRKYMEHGQSIPYTIIYGEIDGSGNFVREDVTNQTEVTSGNTSVFTVDQINAELIATSNQQVNRQTYVRANYTNDDGEEFTNTKNITVANKTVNNLDILPTWTRVSAVLEGGTDDNPEDRTVAVVFIATAVGALVAYIATSFAGIAALLLVVLCGWTLGMVDDGVVIAAVLMSSFVGLNVAGNVDYTVRK